MNTHRTQDNTKLYKTTQRDLEMERLLQQSEVTKMTQTQINALMEATPCSLPMTDNGNHPPPHSQPSLERYSQISLKKNVPINQMKKTAHPLESKEENVSTLVDLKRQAQIAKAKRAKAAWEQAALPLKKVTKEDPLSCTVPQSLPQVSSLKEVQNTPEKDPAHQSLYQTHLLPRCPKYVEQSTLKKMPSQTVSTECGNQDLDCGLTLQVKLRETKTLNTKQLMYSDPMFNKLVLDVNEALPNDLLYTTNECIHYIKNNVMFNGESTLGLDLVKFTGVNRHARFIEVFASFIHIIELCKDEDMNNTMDNIITVALSQRSLAIVILTILGKATFSKLLYVNRDIGDSVKILGEMTNKIDVDELFNT